MVLMFQYKITFLQLFFSIKCSSLAVGIIIQESNTFSRLIVLIAAYCRNTIPAETNAFLGLSHKFNTMV